MKWRLGIWILVSGEGIVGAFGECGELDFEQPGEMGFENVELFRAIGHRACGFAASGFRRF
jgi:hypothetical protein